MTNTREIIAANVRAAIARSGKKQRELVPLLGIRQETLSLKLNGRRSFVGEELAIIASATDTTPGALIEGAAPVLPKFF